jgi:integrase
VRRDGETLVCPRYNGEPRRPQSITIEFDRFVRRLKLPRITFQGLRHSHATQLLPEGVHPKIAQERLGHSTISTTLDLYSHVTNTMDSNAAERLNGAWKKAFGSKLGSGGAK